MISTVSEHNIIMSFI